MTNDITILSCPICNSPKLREYGNGTYRCDVCETYFDKDENVVLTEQEYLQTCNTEQLAKVLLSFCQYPCEICKIECDGGNACTYNKALNTIVEWLKQPHTFE